MRIFNVSILSKVMATLMSMSLAIELASQDCSCAAQFAFVKNYFEANNPAFQKIKSNPTAFSVYKKNVKLLTEKVHSDSSSDRCNIYFEKYITLLKDHHSRIDLNLHRIKIDLNSPKVMDSFKASASYQSFKKIPIDTAGLIATLGSKPNNDVEGIYTSRSGIMVGVMATSPGNYRGVVLRKNKFLDIGHILFELKKKKDETFDCVYHTGLLAVNFQNVYRTVRIKNGSIPDIDFSKTGAATSMDTRPYEFRELDSSTNYLKLRSFDRSLKQQLDSFYRSVEAAIEAKPYLVIDLRDNGGGAEECYFELMKYIYTDPLETDDVEVWVTPENIKRYEERQYNPKLIDRMKQSSPYTFIPQIENATNYWTMTGTTAPKKIAILFNRITASAAEGLVTYAIQSKKVITIGENSGGYIGYGDVMPVSVPCEQYIIQSTTTRYHKNAAYEFVGIKPMYWLSDKEDWIRVATSLLKK